MSNNLPALEPADLFEGTAECACSHAAKPKMAGEKLEAIAEPLPAAEPLVAADAVPKAGTAVCRPWVRIERDVSRMRDCMKVAEKMGRLETSRQLFELIAPQMQREDQEVYWVIAADTQLYLRGIAEIARGARDRVLTPIADTARYALAFALYHGAMGLAISHCHPSGKVKPSDADKDVTRAVKKMCDAMEILFLDHIIVGLSAKTNEPEYYSFRDAGLLK